ncbi:MAG: hypothetical protein SFX74_05095 [Fimbriimonadaceae bacterium]|nr:hypothetical protein [Fimbriimonadaceae bacterium]
MNRNIALLIVAAAGIAAVVGAQAARILVINGRVASTDVRMINGRAYAPIADIAKALDLTVVPRGNGYELTRAGGSNGVSARLTGRTGDWLFDGGWRFQVTGVRRVDRHERKYPYYSETEISAEEGKTLVIVEFAARNGNRTSGSLELGDSQLTLSGVSEVARDFDLNFDGTRNITKAILPGAETCGAIIWQVDAGSVPQDFVLTFGQFTHYDDAVRPKQATVLRVNLR